MSGTSNNNQCSNCGAQLEVTGSATSRCDYCGGVFDNTARQPNDQAQKTKQQQIPQQNVQDILNNVEAQIGQQFPEQQQWMANLKKNFEGGNVQSNVTTSYHKQVWINGKLVEEAGTNPAAVNPNTYAAPQVAVTPSVSVQPQVNVQPPVNINEQSHLVTDVPQAVATPSTVQEAPVQSLQKGYTYSFDNKDANKSAGSWLLKAIKYILIFIVVFLVLMEIAARVYKAMH